MGQRMKKISNYMQTMAGPITRLMIYISIACLTSLMKDLSSYDALSDITPLTWILILINFTLQGLVAWRAYIDGSYQEAVDKIEEGKKLAAEQEKVITNTVSSVKTELING
jgi:hypothetical protein